MRKRLVQPALRPYAPAAGRSRRVGRWVSALLALTLSLPAPSLAGSLTFATAPTLPTLTSVTLNASAQTVDTTMTNFAVSDTRTGEKGWNVTAQGQSGTKKSAVFAQYCPKAKCGAAVEGYIAAGKKLAADSLTLNSTGATLTGGTHATPSLQCAAGCSLDNATAVKVLSATTSEGTWTTSGFSATSLALAVPTTVSALPSEEVYHVNILWTLATGP